MKILANPVLLRGDVVLLCASGAFLLGMIFIRRCAKALPKRLTFPPKLPR